MPPKSESAMYTHDAPTPNNPAPNAKPIQAAIRGDADCRHSSEERRERERRQLPETERCKAEHGRHAEQQCRDDEWRGRHQISPVLDSFSGSGVSRSTSSV